MRDAVGREVGARQAAWLRAAAVTPAPQWVGAPCGCVGGVSLLIAVAVCLGPCQIGRPVVALGTALPPSFFPIATPPTQRPIATLPGPCSRPPARHKPTHVCPRRRTSCRHVDRTRGGSNTGTKRKVGEGGTGSNFSKWFHAHTTRPLPSLGWALSTLHCCLAAYPSRLASALPAPAAPHTVGQRHTNKPTPPQGSLPPTWSGPRKHPC